MKKITFYAFVLTAAIIVSGCSNGLSLPKSVSVKTNAEYNFSIKNFSQDMGDAFNMSNYIKSSDDYTVYNYNPNNSSKIQKYLIKMPIQQVPIDFAAFLDGSILSEYLENMSIDEKTVTIPQIDISAEQDIDINKINDFINTMVSITGVTGTNTAINFAFEAGNNFTTISYKSGYLAVKGLDTTLTGKASLLYKNSEGTFENISSADFNSSGIAYIPLDNKTIYSTNLYMSFTGEANKNFAGQVTDGSVVSTATGISKTDPCEVPVTSVFSVAGGSSDLHSCTFGTGSTLTFSIALPSWTGVSLTGLDVNLSGGMDPSFNISGNESSWNDSTKTYSITSSVAGKTFNNKAIDASTTAKIKLNNATLDLTLNPKINISSNIPKLNATVKLSADFNATVDKSLKFSDETKKMMKQIVWNPSGIKVSAINSFPEGNDMDLTIKSLFFDCNNVTKTITSNSSSAQNLDYLCAQDHTTEIGDSPKFGSIDFLAALTLPGYTEDGDTKLATFSNVVMGETYSVKINIEPVFDWKEETLDTTDSHQSGKISSGIKLSSIFAGFDKTFPGSEISKKMQISKLPVYLYCEIPEVEEFKDYKFSGIIKAYIGDEDLNPKNAEKEYLLGKYDEDSMAELNEAMSLRKVPEFEVNVDDVVTTNYTNETANADLANLMNSENADDGVMCIEYDATLSNSDASTEIVITKETAATLSSASINLTAILVLSMDFDVKDDVTINVSKTLVGMDESYDDSDLNADLLGRTEKPNLESIQKYVDVIEEIAIVSKASKVPFYSSEPIVFSVDLDGPHVDADGDTPAHGDEFEEKSFPMDGGSFSVNPTKLLSLYPLHPVTNMVIKKGSFSLPREMLFETDIKLKIKTDGTVTLFGEAPEEDD